MAEALSWPPHLEQVEPLGKGANGLVFRATDARTGQAVAVKRLQGRGPDSLLALKQEFRRLADICHPNLVRLNELHGGDGLHWCFTMELIPGSPFLDRLLAREKRTHGEQRGKPDVVQGFARERTATATELLDPAQQGKLLTAAPSQRAPVRGATHDPAEATVSSSSTPHPYPISAGELSQLRDAFKQLLEGVAHLHAYGQLHCDIKPSNIQVTEHGRVVLLDFGISRAANGSDDDGSSRAGSVPYMAPEQVCGGALGPATDLYAVGSMLYQALTGRRPFEGSVAHILREKQRSVPPVPSRLRRGIPIELEQLVLAMLQPEPSARPSLEAAYRVVAGEPLPTGPVSLTASGSEIFVGRESELSRVGQVLEQASGAPELRGLVVVGEPGIGKSALIEVALSRLRETESLILRSRCHQQEELPLRALDRSVDTLARLLLKSPEGGLPAIGERGARCLLSLFPVLGSVPELTSAAHGELPPPNVVREVGAKCLRALLKASANGRSVVLVVDDLQWADEASIAFLAALLEPSECAGIVFLATARPATAGTADPLSRIAQMAPRTAAVLNQLPLQGLPEKDALELCRRVGDETLACVDSALLARESGGNPLLLKELTQFRQDTSTKGHGLLETLQARIAALPGAERRIMEAVATAGAPVDLEAIAEALGDSVADTHYYAQSLRSQNLLQVQGHGSSRKFNAYHDRVREALEAQLEHQPGHRQALHSALGWILYGRLASGSDPSTAIFSVARHLNAGGPTSDEGMRTQIAEVNLQAGTQALQLTDHAAALSYFRAGLRVCPERDTAALRVDLELSQLRATYLVGHFDAAEALFRPLVDRVRRPEEIARLYAIRMQLDINAGRDEAALETGHKGLALLGVTLPRAPGKTTVIAEVIRTRLALRGRSAKDLLLLPETDDPTALGIQKLCYNMMHAALRVYPDLMAVIILRSLRLLLRQGLTPLSSVTLANYGVILAGPLVELEQAEEYRQCAVQLKERFADSKDAARGAAGAFIGGFLAPWALPARECIALCRGGYEEGLREGDEVMSYVNLLLLCGLMDYQGAPLAELASVTREAWEATRKRELENWSRSLQVVLCQTETLANAAETPYHGLDQIRPPARWGSSLCSFLWHSARARVALIVRDWQTLSEAIAPMEATAHQVVGVFSSVWMVYLRVRANCHALAERAEGPWRRRSRRVQLRADFKLLSKWEQACPANHRALHLLALAAHAVSFAPQERANLLCLRCVAWCQEAGHEGQLAEAWRLHAELSGDDASRQQAIAAATRRGEGLTTFAIRSEQLARAPSVSDTKETSPASG